MKVLKNFTQFPNNIKNQKLKLSQIPMTREAVNLELNQSTGQELLRQSDV